MEGQRFRMRNASIEGQGDEFMSRREKKAAGLEQHRKLQREKNQKRKQKKQISLPTKHLKGKK
jgi:hypothetical protein